MKLSQKLTQQLTDKPRRHGLNREEFSAMAELSAAEGHLAPQESQMMQNLLRLPDIRVSDVMTPRTVVFCAEENIRIADFFKQHEPYHFSRIPIYPQSLEKVTGFVLRSDLLNAMAQGKDAYLLKHFRRDITATMDSMTLSQALNEFIHTYSHLMLVVNEYGDMMGIITQEDIFETLLGLEIMDENDSVEDMQKMA